MAQSESSTPCGHKGLRLYNIQPTASGSAAFHHNRLTLSSTRCSSPNSSMAGVRKRPLSPEVTTGSLSTLASYGKKPCFSALSDSKQPRTLLNYYPYHKHAALPAQTALTSAVTEADEDDFDEAVSSFRAPPGHIPHPDDLPQHFLQPNTHQPPYGLSLPAHHQNLLLFHNSHSPLPCGNRRNNMPLPSSSVPLYSSSSTSVYRAIPFGSRPTPSAYMPAAGIISGSAESASSQQAAAFAQQPSLMSSDQTDSEAKHVLRRHNLPPMGRPDFPHTQVRCHGSKFLLLLSLQSQ